MYRTDVTFGWLDLMVAFGGIAGLFLGCSILSGLEIVYYLMILLLTFARKLKVRTGKLFNSRSNEVKDFDARKNNGKIRKRSENVRVIKIRSLSDDKSDTNKTQSRY